MFSKNYISFRFIIIFLFSTFYINAQVITQTVTYAAGIQTLAIPACVPFVTITCYGASGADGTIGANNAPGGVGGKGAIARGVYSITPTASVLNIYTGGVGTGTLGGFNGGGGAGNGLGIGGAGGGSTDVRVGGIAIANRIIVAGGGGGGGNAGCATATIGGGNGGNGGGSAGLNGSSITSGTDIVTGGFGGVGQTAGTLAIGCSTLVTAATNGGGNTSGVGGKGGFSTSTLCCCSSIVSGGGGGGGYRGGGGGAAGAMGSANCVLSDRASGGGGAGGTNFFAAGFTSTLVSVASFTGNGFVEIAYQTVPVPTITVNSGTVCEGSAFSIVPSGAVSYIYQGGSASVSPPSTSIYTVVGNNGLNCVSASVSSTVTVIPRPVLSISPANNPICSNTSYIAIPAGANIYTFSIGPSSVIGTTANIPGPTNTTTLNIVGSNTLTTCLSLPISVVFTVIPRPVVTVNSGSICAGNSYTIVPSGAVTYSIQGGSFAVSPTAIIRLQEQEQTAV